VRQVTLCIVQLQHTAAATTTVHVGMCLRATAALHKAVFAGVFLAK
jgi:hypothetical protein